MLATRNYQRAQVSLRALTYRDITRLWSLLDVNRLDATFTIFAAGVLRLVAVRRAASVALARSYLVGLRAGVPGELPVVEDPALNPAALLSSLRFVSVVSIKTAMTRGTSLDLANRRALVRTMGAVDKFIGDGGRELIRATVEADPAAEGWIRRTLGTCEFCAEQAAGDDVKSGLADFPRHDHCGCQPEPVFVGAEPVDLDQLNADLTIEERMQVDRYQWGKSGPGMAYQRANYALREGLDMLPDLKPMVDGLDSAIAKSVLTDEIAVHRGMLDVGDWADNLVPGGTISDAGFISTSGDAAIIEDFAWGVKSLTMEIRVPASRGRALITGKDLLEGTPMTANYYQREVILRRGSTFRVLEWNPETRHAVLELIV